MAYESQRVRFNTGEERFVHRWFPATPVRSILIIVHGLGDHGGRFDRLARWFTNHGVAVQALDLIGHGQSPGRRGCIRDYNQLLEDINISVASARLQWTNCKCFLFGQSMGGNLVLNWALRKPHDVVGVIASASMLRAARPPNALIIQFLRVVEIFFPNFCIRKPVRVKWLCRDRNNQQAYINDPFVHNSLL